MATYEEVINGNINSLKELKELVKSYKDELATAKEGSQEWEDACEGLAVAQERVDKIQKAAKGTLEGYNNSAKDSINTLKARIKELNTERNAMDMNSAEYADATARLKEMNDRLRESGVAAGDMKANVGNYAQSLAAGFEGVKTAVSDASSQMITAIGGLGQSLGGLSPTMNTVATGLRGITAAAGPVAIALAAISAVLAAFKEGVQSSEENTNKFKQALAPIEAVLIIIQRAIQEATSKVLDWMIALRNNEKVINGLKTAVTVIITTFKTLKDIITGLVTVFDKFWGKIKEFGQKAAKTFEPVTKAVGKVANAIGNKLKPVIDKLAEKSGLKENFEEAKKEAEELGKTISNTTDKVEDANKKENALQKAKRALLKENTRLAGEMALKELEINEERNKEVKDYDKILELINEKTELQIQQAKNNVAIKQQELAIIRQRNAMADSNSKDIDAETAADNALAEAVNAVTIAQAAGEKEKEKIIKAKRTQELTTATNEYTAALKNLEAEYTNTVASIEKPTAPEATNPDTINTYHDQLLANYQAEYDAYTAMTEGKIAEEEKLIEERKKLGLDTSVQEANIANLRADNAKKYTELLKKQNDVDKDRTKKLKSYYNAQLGDFSELLGNMSNMFEQNTIAYKVTATAKAILDTYMAANAALANAGGLPWGAIPMAATIAAGIANVMAIWKTDTNSPSIPSTTQQNATSVPQVDDTPYTYAQTVQTVSAEESLNQSQEPLKVYVLESDITDAQNKNKVRVAESSF